MHSLLKSYEKSGTEFRFFLRAFSYILFKSEKRGTEKMEIENNVLLRVKESDVSVEGKINIPDSVTSIGQYAFNHCEKLRKITFKNQTYSVKCVDGYCMVVLREKQMQDITILKCVYFPEMTGAVYVAEKDGYAAHGETIRDAIEDLKFKILQDTNVEEHIQRIKQQGYMNAEDYRLLTGACREGTKRFLQKHGLTWEDTMPVAQVLEITKGQYGSEKFQTAVEQIL